MGVAKHRGVHAPVGPGLGDTGLAPGRKGGDCPLPAEMEGVQDRQHPYNHSPGSLWPCLAASKWAVLASEHLQTQLWRGEAGHRPPLPPVPYPNPLTACPCSSLEMTCYDSDEANPRSVSSLSNRSSPLSWRYGQSSPRLQAGDAPSVGGTCRSEGTPSWYMHGERAHYSHTMPMRSPSKLSHISRLELVEALDTDDVELKSGYMSDSDLMGKTLTEDDDITTGYVPVRGVVPKLGFSGRFHLLLFGRRWGNIWHSGGGWSGT